MMAVLQYLLFATFFISSLQADLKILETPSGTHGPAPCALTCTGVQTGSWDYSIEYSGKAFVNEDITGCGFKSAPIVTVNVHGVGLCPPVTMRHRDSSRFLAYTSVDATVADMNNRQCVVQWSAFGYNC